MKLSIAAVLIILFLAILGKAETSEQKLASLLATLSATQASSSTTTLSTETLGTKKAFSHKRVKGSASRIATLLKSMKEKYSKDIKESYQKLLSNRARRAAALAKAKSKLKADRKTYYDAKGRYEAIKAQNEIDEEKDVDRHESFKDQCAQEMDLIEQMEKLLNTNIDHEHGGSGFTDSKIMSSSQRAFLKKSVGRGSWKLCWRGSRDGFSAGAFHNRCDNKGATVTVVKSRRGNIFGGYTSLPWDGQARYKTDPHSFLFSLKGGQRSGRPYIVKRKRAQHSVYDNRGYGPTFGAGHDMYISNSMRNTNANYLGRSSYSTLRNGELNGGQYRFAVSEIEVYYNARKAKGYNGSKILNEKMRNHLRKWSPYGDYQLVYRGSRDGFNAAAFHKKANSYDRTMTVIKSNHGSIFGGFTTIPWRGQNRYKNTGTGFLYTFKSGNSAERFFTRSNNYQTYDHVSYGPTFGNGHDLYIANNMKSNSNYCNSAHAYATPGRGYLNGGNYNFVVSEIEVYADLSKTRGFKDSKILSTTQATNLKKMINGGKYELCFRASRDGWSGSTFHKNCNEKGSSVTIIRSNRGNIFGGYSAIPWRNANSYKNYGNAFLFSLKRNGRDTAERFAQKKWAHYNYDHVSYGPTFGGGHDLYVPNNMRSNGYLNTGHTFFGSRGYLNGGNYHFRPNELEVYVSKN